MERPRSWLWALAVVVALGVAALGALLWGRDDGSPDAPSSTSTDRSTTSSTSTSAQRASTTTAAGGAGDVPAAVGVVSAGPGGGSGEVALSWDAVARATGYRVLRSGGPDGPFEVVADLDVTAGTATAAADVVNIWSEQHSYVPSEGRLDAPDRSPWFQYVDVSGSTSSCFEVVAYNTAGDASASSVTCGSPP